MSKIKFHCASPVTVEAEWDETVLDALLRTGTPVPFFCRSGICGQCKSKLSAGEVMHVGTAPPILSQDEVGAGMVLICCSVATQDCEITPQHLPVNNDELPWPVSARVAEASWVTPKLFHLRVAVAPGADAPTFLFHPGQYTFLQAPRDERWDLPSRLYPATRPGHDFIDFHLSPKNARQSQSFDEAFRIGASVQLAKPVGASCLKEGEKGPAVLVANAVGLPAVLSMIELLRMRDDRSGVHVVVRGDAHGHLESEVVRECADAGIDLQFCDEHGVRAALERVAQSVTAMPCRSGRRPQVYVKGDESLVRTAREVFYARGLKPWEVHAETIEGTDWSFLE